MSEAAEPRVRQTRGTDEPFTHTRIEREEASQPRRDTTTEEEDQETTDKGDKEKVDIAKLQRKEKDAGPQRHGRKLRPTKNASHGRDTQQGNEPQQNKQHETSAKTKPEQADSQERQTTSPNADEETDQQP